MKTLEKIKNSVRVGLLAFGLAFSASVKAQSVQYLMANTTVPIGLSNIVSGLTAVKGSKISVHVHDLKLTGAGTSGVAFVLEASNNNTDWTTTTVQFWRAANGATAVGHITNLDIGPFSFLRWKIHNSNSVAVTNTTVTMIVKDER